MSQRGSEKGSQTVAGRPGAGGPASHPPDEVWQRYQQSDPASDWVQMRRKKRRRQNLIRSLQDRFRINAVESERALAGNVLFLVDETTYREYVEKMLIIRGHEVQTTRRVSDFINWLSRNSVDVVVVNVASGNGFELARILKTNPTLKAIPFILCSESTKREDLVAAHRINITNWFVRPFRTDEFVDVVSEQVHLARQKLTARKKTTVPAGVDGRSDSIVIRGGRRNGS